jgi:hypothetical protein
VPDGTGGRQLFGEAGRVRDSEGSRASSNADQRAEKLDHLERLSADWTV